MCVDNSIVSKTKKKLWVQFGKPPRFKALPVSNPEQLLVFKAPFGDDSRPTINYFVIF